MSEGLVTTRSSARTTGSASIEGACSDESSPGAKQQRVFGLGTADAVQIRRPFALERRAVEILFRRIGRPAIQLVLWDGTAVGEHSSAIGRVVVHNPRGLRRLLISSTLGFGEGIMANDITVEGDLISVLTELNRAITQTHSTRRQSRLSHWLWSRHSLASSKACVYRHYDIGNDFYRLWLDRQLVYTCAYYPSADSTLDEAQLAKLDYICRKLRLKSGETVVEAGCGWGALALHMARNYGVKVRAYNLSREQLAWAKSRAREENLSSRVEFIQDDYRNISGKADVFVSVGMLEHVGDEHYREMGRLVDRVLTEQGRGLIHSIGRNIARPLDRWTLKYIFPKAYVPSLREMMDIFEEGQLSVVDVENLRCHYARTCADWLERFESNAPAVRQMFDERFVHMWRLYLAASAAAFLNGDLQLFQVLFTRPAYNQLPPTRREWYE